MQLLGFVPATILAMLCALDTGRNFWMPLEEFLAAEGKSPAMDEYMTCFLGEAGELFAKYDEEGTDPLIVLK